MVRGQGFSVLPVASLAGGMADEFTNILATIIGLAFVREQKMASHQMLPSVPKVPLATHQKEEEHHELVL